MNAPREIGFEASRSAGSVSGLLLEPSDAEWLLVFAHGAGADMRHAFMESVSERLAARRIATFRYQFPYTERRRRRPDPRPLLLATVRSAVEAAAAAAPALPLLAGGKSMGGRMTSLAASEEPLPGVRGIVLFGFPLHPAGRAGSERADHLARVEVPMLFLQGTRDKLAELPLLEPICAALGARARLHVVEGGDHSFHVLVRSGRSDAEVLDELCDEARAFASSVSC
ncbi:MAG: alpha/beta hydrolase [Proteobacteria bacterium]|nr:alpha/beta hydrolase [Pseudomonadota bacterium]